MEKHLSRAELVSVRLLLLLALGIAGYLGWGSQQGGGVPGCGPESDCDKVLGSRWAYVLGVPVSLFAMPVYLLSLVFTFPRTIPWGSLLPLAMMILVGAVWFIGLQLFAIGSFCKFCMAAHFAGMVAALLIVRRNPLPRFSRIVSAGTALTLGVMMALAQVTSPAPAPRQVSLIGAETQKNDTNLEGKRSEMEQPSQTDAPVNPIFSIVRGQFSLDLRKLPVIGSLNAPKRMVKLFDYTCHHCRDLHHLLESVAPRFSNELAIVSLPMPLDASCNPVLRSTSYAHANACEFARLALAIFYAEPAKFNEFSNWLFGPERPPELNRASEVAGEMLGRERLEAALQDPRIEEQIRLNCFIYAASSQLGKSSALPQMIFPTGVSIGAVADQRQLEKILADALGLRAPGTNQSSASLSKEL
jgi:uncharacterized membrane protein